MKSDYERQDSAYFSYRKERLSQAVSEYKKEKRALSGSLHQKREKAIDLIEQQILTQTVPEVFYLRVRKLIENISTPIFSMKNKKFSFWHKSELRDILREVFRETDKSCQIDQERERNKKLETEMQDLRQNHSKEVTRLTQALQNQALEIASIKQCLAQLPIRMPACLTDDARGPELLQSANDIREAESFPLLSLPFTPMSHRLQAQSAVVRSQEMTVLRRST
jgi:hypothetical protein